MFNCKLIEFNYMVHSIILIALGFVMWKYLPGKITAASKKTRSYIDLGFQIVGILLMLSGGVELVRSIFNLF